MKKINTFILIICAFYMASAFAQENLNTTRIGVWPYGRGNTVACFEDHVFLSHGRVLQVYEYTNPEQPQLLGEVFTDDMISVLTFHNGMAYAAGYEGFFILDVANPNQPEIVSQLNISSLARAVSISGNLAYLALNDQHIYIIDISDPQNPATVAVHEMEHLTNDLVILDGLAWIAAGSSGIVAYDMNDPQNPVLVYQYTDSGNMRTLAFVDDLLYAFDNNLGLMIFDIANLPAFNLLSTTYIDDNGADINIENDVLAVTLTYGGFALYDISNPSAPDSIGMFYADMPNRQVILKDGYAFHCCGSAFNIFDITNPNEMNLLSSIGLSGTAFRADNWNNHIYVTAISTPIMILDITNPENVVKVSEIEKVDASYEVHVNDNLLFRGHYSQVMVYDIAEPSNPVFLNSFPTATNPEKILKHNNLLFVSHFENLEVFDISDIMSPNLLGDYNHVGTYDMIAEGNLLYLCNTSDVIILDISDPSNISELSSTQNNFSRSLALKDSLLYVVSSVHTIPGNSLNVFNVTDPTSIFRVSSLEQNKEFENVLIDGDYLFVHERHVGLQIYDIQELTPVYCGFYSNSLYDLETEVVNGIIYVPVIAGIDVVQNDLITSTENHFIDHNESLNVFPNPTAGFINVELQTENPAGVFTWEVTQMNGVGVKSGKLTAGQRQISIEGLPSGVYILTIKRNGRIISSEKIIKQ